MITFILLLIFIIVILYHYYTQTNRLRRLINKIPGPKSYPFVGSSLEIVANLENFWSYKKYLRGKYYPIYKYWIGTVPVVSSSDPDDIKIILSSYENITKAVHYEILWPWFKDGLLTSSENKWRIHRKIITPSFHLNILKEYIPIIEEHVNKFIENCYSIGKTFEIDDLIPVLSRLTLNIICSTTMGCDLNDNDPLELKYRKSVHSMTDMLFYRVMRPWLSNDWIFALSPAGRIQRRTLKTLHEFTSNIIQQRKIEANKKCLNREASSAISTKNKQQIGDKRKVFLDHLIEVSKLDSGLNDDDIKNQVDTFIFAGHETTSVGLFFIILLLSQHKDVQNRARAEFDDVFNSSNGKITMAEIKKLIYLECCIKESLRLYPSIPILARKITTDLQLKNYLVPRGSVIDIPIMDVNRNPHFWANPDKFDPNRFLSDDETKNIHPFSYIPFSAGPRNCIGQKFAMLEMKIILGKLLHSFYLESSGNIENLKIHLGLLMRPAQPVPFKLIPIDK